ncbi:hypothetical protein [Streptomyces sp. 049-1]|uniref:hypothetical protein n=1 Tax=Streptomyces sp. 049-1 TaxID=2789264 RepID=UPI00397F0D4A
MLDHVDALILFILGGLFINPRRYRTVYRAMGAAVLTGAATAGCYLLAVRPLLGVLL